MAIQRILKMQNKTETGDIFEAWKPNRRKNIYIIPA